jgi:hypothetical protein
MTFRIEIKQSEFCKWPIYHSDWQALGINMLNNGFNVMLKQVYPEIIDIEYVPDVMAFDRYFTFESEEHYHWFLLKL